MILSIYNIENLKTEQRVTNHYEFKNFLSEEEIENIIKISENFKYVDGIVGGGNKDKSIRSSKIKWISMDIDTVWLYKKIQVLVNLVNNKMWNFDLVGFGEDIQYGEYSAEQEGHYDWHLDISNDVNYRKISISIQLTDPEEYEGGELQILKGRKETTVSKGKGTAVVFPSYLMHRVKKVTKGIRKSLVIWISGKPFR